VAVRAVLRRAFTLYWVQILISLLIVAIFAGAAALWDEDDLLEDADAVVSNPLQTTAAILALLHQLDNANILPLYIALLLMTPLLLVLARRDDRLMLAAAAGIYLAARAFSLNLSTWPVEGTWFFNPIAWQLIFAIGIFAGRRFKRGGIAYDARLFAACLAVVAIAAVVRTDAFGYASGLWQDVHDVLDCGKTDLGFARLVHFLALAYIVYHSGLTGLIRRTRAFLPLCLIGRYGLPVFATGTVLSVMGEVIVETRSEAFSHEVALGAAIVAAASLCIISSPAALPRGETNPERGKADELGAHLTNGFVIVLAEVSNRLVVRNKPALQPHLSFPKIISACSSGAVRTRLV